MLLSIGRTLLFTATAPPHVADRSGAGCPTTTAPRRFASLSKAAMLMDPRDRPNWSARYRKLLPFAEARKTVRSIGFRSKEDWDEWVAEGKSLPWLGPYMPSQPNLMYADDWLGWDDWLGTMLPFEEARACARQLGITTQEAWWALVSERPEFVSDLRIPARPHIVYRSQWLGYDDWLGLEPTTLYAPRRSPPDQREEGGEK